MPKKNTIKKPMVLPPSWKLFTSSLQLMKDNWKVIGGVLVVYGLLSVIFVGNLTDAVLIPVKNTLAQTNTFKSAVGSLFYLFANSGSTATELAAAYQSFFVILASLALIWNLRQIQAGKNTGVKLGYYRGIHPLVPFILVLFFIFLQLLPLFVGGGVYATVTTNGIAVVGLEKFFWGLLFFLSSLVSLYMVSSSIFALYIVTLPDMTPKKALRSARALVLNRRWQVMRKLIFLPLITLILTIIIMLPVILWLPALAVWAFFVISLIALALLHSYLYTLYRELL